MGRNQAISIINGIEDTLFNLASMSPKMIILLSSFKYFKDSLF